eukprot:508015-Rhodomonas_salina.1
MVVFLRTAVLAIARHGVYHSSIKVEPISAAESPIDSMLRPLRRVLYALIAPGKAITVWPAPRNCCSTAARHQGRCFVCPISSTVPLIRRGSRVLTALTPRGCVAQEHVREGQQRVEKLVPALAAA